MRKPAADNGRRASASRRTQRACGIVCGSPGAIDTPNTNVWIRRFVIV
jgi:hypothetical protein